MSKRPLRLMIMAPIALAMATLGALAGHATETPRRGGTLKVIVEPEPSTLMVGLSSAASTLLVGGKIYEGLLSFDPALKARPALAQSWAVAENLLTYTFHLRQGVRWHDGAPFTAADVVFSIKTFLPETSPRARSIFAHVTSVQALDPYTVELKLDQPFAPLLLGLDAYTTPIIPRHLYEGSEYRKNPANEKPIGTGPFRFGEWQRGSYIKLVRNDDYWAQGKPYLDGIDFRIIPDASSRALAFELGEVDLIKSSDVEPFELPRLAKLPGVQTASSLLQHYNSIVMLEVNLRNAPMNDRRFREALRRALDLDFIKNNLWLGFANVATGPIASTSPFYDPDIQRYDFNVKKAATLLDEMGLKPGPNGYRVTLRLTPPARTEYQRLAEYIAQQLAQIGIKVELVRTDMAGWSQRLGDWDFDLALNALDNLFDPAIGVARSYVSSNIAKGNPFGNIDGYSNPTIDALFDKATTTVKDEERRRLYREIQRVIVADLPIVWLIEADFPALHKAAVGNVVTSSIGIYDNFAETFLRQ